MQFFFFKDQEKVIRQILKLFICIGNKEVTHKLEKDIEIQKKLSIHLIRKNNYLQIDGIKDSHTMDIYIYNLNLFLQSHDTHIIYNLFVLDDTIIM